MTLADVHAVTLPPVLLMPELRFPIVCGAAACEHAMCLMARDAAQHRCAKCDRVIAAGARYRQWRDLSTGRIARQEHEQCPEGPHES